MLRQWIWDHQLMRQALARMDMAAVAVIFRVGTGMTQGDLADLVPTWSVQTVSRIEGNKRQTLFDLRELMRFVDAVEMPREALIPLIMGDAEVMPDLQDEIESMVVRRRDFNRTAVAAASLVLPMRMTPAPERVTDAHLRLVESRLSSLWSSDWTVGGRTLLPHAVSLFWKVRTILDASTYSADQGQRLLVLGTELAGCAGFLAYDSGDQALARRMLSEGVLLSGSAGDPVRGAYVLATLALQSTYLARVTGQTGPAREALRLLDQAADLARCDPSPRLHVLLDIRRGLAHGVLKDAASARKCFTAAYRTLERGPHEADPHWASYITPTEIAGHEAMTLVDYGDLAGALSKYELVLSDKTLSPRNRAFYAAREAATWAEAGDTGEGVHRGELVLDQLAVTVASTRTLMQLKPIRDAGFDGQFTARFDEIAQTLTGPVE